MDTHDSEHVGRLSLGRRLIANALQYSSAPAASTARFRSLAHDKDLLPATQRQLRILLGAFQRETTAVYDIQGFSDQGCDILVRLQTANETEFIGLQVKSHPELTDMEVVNKIILQYAKAVDYYRSMSTFYVALCADITQTSKRTAVIRRIHQELATKPAVRVIDPTYMATFLSLSRNAMDGLITRTMRTGDPLMGPATADLMRHPLHAAITLTLVINTVEGGKPIRAQDLVDDPWLQSICWKLPLANPTRTTATLEHDRPFHDENEFRRHVGLPPLHHDEDDEDDEPWNVYAHTFHFDALSKDLLKYFMTPEWPVSDARSRLESIMPRILDTISDDLVQIDPTSGQVDLPLAEHSALLCLAAEGRERHDLEGRDLVDYLVQLVITE